MKKIELSFILFLGLAFSNASCQNATRHDKTYWRSADVAEFKMLIEKQSGVLLDVRTPSEFGEGHIAGAINIDYESESFKTEIEKLDKAKQYQVYCRSGRRSALASEEMGKSGFIHVINLEGGILSWEKNGQETVK